MSRRVLILGASYGQLFAMRLALAGHRVTLVGRAAEIAQMAQTDLRLDLTARRSGEAIHLVLPHGQGVALCTPDQADPAAADLVVLAMQEPHYADPAVAALIGRIGQSGRPCLSIMNLPPPPFLARLGISGAVLEGVYSSGPAWRALAPDRITLASPDAQALRLDPDMPGHLTVTLASNFKVAPFARGDDQALLEELARDWAAFKHQDQRPPVQLLAQHSLHVPLAKWPMLIAGNCRSHTAAGPVAIAQAVHRDLAQSERLYAHVQDLVRVLGAREADLVPFAAYARAALELVRPSSLARALANGAMRVERIDLLVLRLMAAHGLDGALLAPIVAEIEARLTRNQNAAS